MRKKSILPRENPFGPVISAWSFKSSSGTTTYETQLHKDGKLTCDCPGWCIQKKDKNTGILKPRYCKHTEEKSFETKEILAGRRNPVFEGNKVTIVEKIVEVTVKEPTFVVRNSRRLLRTIPPELQDRNSGESIGDVMGDWK